MSEVGAKHDAGKPRWSLLPLGIIAQVIGVLEFGAKRYSVNNWQHVPDARLRYYDATMRHIEAWWRGELNDPESGKPHLAHAVCCLLFLMWFDAKEKPKCFGTFPLYFPSIQAERCCNDCQFRTNCYEVAVRDEEKT